MTLKIVYFFIGLFLFGMASLLWKDSPTPHYPAVTFYDCEVNGVYDVCERRR